MGSIKKIIQKNYAIIILFLIMLLGFSLRIYDIGGPSFWVDEFRTYARISGTLEYTLNTLNDSSFPPLYYIIMNPWGKIFGYSESALRFPSLIFSLLTIPAIFLLARELFNEKTGIISAFLLAISVFAISYAQEAKMYSLLWLFGTISFFFFFKFSKNPGRRNLTGYILFTTLCVYTHYIGFVFILIQNILFPLFLRKEIKKWLVAQIAIILFYIPWWEKAIHDFTNQTGIYLFEKTGTPLELVINSLGKISTYTIGSPHIIELALIAIILIVLAGDIWKSFKNNAEYDFHSYSITLAWIIIGILSFVALDTVIRALHEKAAHIIITRYLGFIHIPIIILFAAGITLIEKYKKNTQYLALGILLLLAIFTHLTPYYENDLKITSQDWKGFIKEICSLETEKSLVLYTFRTPIVYYGECLKTTAQYYFNNNSSEIENKHDQIFVLYHTGQLTDQDIGKFLELNPKYKKARNVKKNQVATLNLSKLN